MTHHEVHGWTLLSNHAHVLVVASREPDLRVRDIADLVGITERAVLRILGELEDADVVRRERVGRRTHYRVNLDASLRHPLESHATVGELLEGLGMTPDAA